MFLRARRRCPPSGRCSGTQRRSWRTCSRCTLGREHNADKQTAMQHVLGLSDSDASDLKSLVASGSFKLEQEADEEASFF